MKRSGVLFTLLVCLTPVGALAQTPDVPFVLGAPASARVAALGSAWVAGRDQDVVFSNPAQLVGVRTDFSLSVAHLGPDRTMGSLTSAYAAGKLSFTLGWGGVILAQGDADAPSALGVVAGAVTYRGFRAGVSGKYVSDHQAAADRRALLCDIGVARNVLGGVAGAALQNVGLGEAGGTAGATIPKQFAIGWSATRQAGPLDVGLFTQVTTRKDRTSPAAGVEVGYSWLEGYLVTLRAGARRTELIDQRAGSVGAGFTADRLTIEYALQGFDEGHRAHRVTIRWR
jgi:hypothetical protein